MPEAIRSPRLHTLLSQGKLLHFKKDEAVFSTDDTDNVMLLIEGYIKRYFITNEGSLGVQIVYGPQDVFSLTKVYDLLLGQSIYSGPEVFHYKTMCETQLYSLDGESFAEAVQSDPLLYKELFSEAGHHLRTCIHSIENISLGNAYVRVAHELLFLVQEFGVKTSEGLQLTLPLTHQDIADTLGITRETVTKAITKLREQGVLSNARRFSVLDPKGLEAAAYH